MNKPDPFIDIRDKRMGELNEEQTARATEMWMRENIGPQERYWYPLLQQLFKVIDDLRAWRDVIIDWTVISHIYRAEYEHNPRKALNDLVAWEHQVALDPSVSAEARALQGSNQWHPMTTAPKDNNRPLYLARIVDGKLLELDFDGGYEYWQESHEMPHINGYAWVSEGGIEEPTHWAYQDAGAPPAVDGV